MLSPYLSAVIMGRDEERFIRQCIDSLSGVVDEIVFLDTGSTDNTVALVHAHAHNAAPLVRIRHWEWQDDFSAARNEAARHATGKWILSIDCDEHLEGALTEPGKLKQELRAFHDDARGEWPRLFAKVPLFDVDPTTNAKLSLSHHIRLYPRHHGIRYESPIHNRLVLRDELEGLGVAVLELHSHQLRFHHKGYAPDVIAAKRKHERTERLLKKALAQNRDGLNLYYLGRAQTQLGRLDDALQTLRESRDWFLDQGGHELKRLQAVYLYLLEAMGRAERPATEVYEEAVRALQFFPKSPDLWFEAGRAMLHAEQPEAARGAFQQAERLFPEAEANETSFLPYRAWELYQNQAMAHAALGEVAEGRLALEKAVAANAPAREHIQKLIDSMNTEPLSGVHAGMATVPERLEILPYVVRSILPQVERLTVYLDRWDGEVPGFLLDDDRIQVVQQPDGLMDAGKFQGMVSEGWTHYLTLDDDILYPPDYVQTMVQKLKDHPDAVVGVHGSNLRRPVRSYLRDRDIFAFSRELKEDRRVDILGTGTMAFTREAVPVGLLKLHLHPGMTDVSVNVALQRWQIPRVAIERSDNWLIPLEGPEPGLYEQGMEHGDDLQTWTVNQVQW